EMVARECLKVLREESSRFGLPECLELLAGVASAHGQFERAGRLYGATESVREATGLAPHPGDRAPFDRHLAAARAGLGEAAFAAAWAAGRAVSPEQAIDEA